MKAWKVVRACNGKIGIWGAIFVCLKFRRKLVTRAVPCKYRLVTIIFHKLQHNSVFCQLEIQMHNPADWLA